MSAQDDDRLHSESRRTMKATYLIIRRYSARGMPALVVKRGVTLKEAQEHCTRDDTHGACPLFSWSDGYTKDVGQFDGRLNNIRTTSTWEDKGQ
jgi:hypothetical protein